MPEESLPLPTPPSELDTNQKKILELLKQLTEGGERPKGWSPRSNSPYFNEKSAAQVKYILDVMMADEKKESRCIYYSDFPGISKDTLYSKVNQGFRFLFDNADIDGKYRNFYDSKIIIRKQPGLGILFEFIVDDAVELIAKPLVEIEKKAEWRIKIDEFVERANVGEKIDLQKLRLTDEDVKTVEDSFNTMERPDDWVCMVRNDRIIVARAK